MADQYNGGYAYQEAPEEQKKSGTGTSQAQRSNAGRTTPGGTTRVNNASGTSKQGQNAKADNYYYYDFKHDYYDGYQPSGPIDLRKAADIPIGLVVAGLIFTPFIGMLMIAAKIIGKAQKEEVENMIRNRSKNTAFSGSTQHYTTVSTGKGNYRNSDAQTGSSGPAHYNYAQNKKTSAKSRGGREKGKTGEMVLLILGIILAFAGITSLADSFGWLISYGAEHWIISDIIENIWMMATGGIMTFFGMRMRKTRGLIRKIKAIVGVKDNMAIDEIATALPATHEKTMKLLQKCIDKDEFGPMAYLDMRSEHLVVRGEAPEVVFDPYFGKHFAGEKPGEKAKAKANANAEAEDTEIQESEYQAILRNLRELNEAIPGQEMTAKISKIERITAQIFQVIEADPSKKPQVKKFMGYYLPTAQKILELYAEYEEREVAGEIADKTKKSIEDSMDSLVAGFEKQLDKLYSHEAMDVSADIATLNSMLKQDGLVKNDELTLG